MEQEWNADIETTTEVNDVRHLRESDARGDPSHLKTDQRFDFDPATCIELVRLGNDTLAELVDARTGEVLSDEDWRKALAVIALTLSRGFQSSSNAKKVIENLQSAGLHQQAKLFERVWLEVRDPWMQSFMG